jgi:hypothetical protein
VSPTLVKSVASTLDVYNANSKSDIAFHSLPTAATSTIMDLNQPKPLMKLHISTEQIYYAISHKTVYELIQQQP